MKILLGFRSRWTKPARCAAPAATKIAPAQPRKVGWVMSTLLAELDAGLAGVVSGRIGGAEHIDVRAPVDPVALDIQPRGRTAPLVGRQDLHRDVAGVRLHGHRSPEQARIARDL